MIPTMGAAMKGSNNSLRENRAQHGGHGFHLRLSTLQGSKYEVVLAVRGMGYKTNF